VGVKLSGAGNLKVRLRDGRDESWMQVVGGSDREPEEVESAAVMRSGNKLASQVMDV